MCDYLSSEFDSDLDYEFEPVFICNYENKKWAIFEIKYYFDNDTNNYTNNYANNDKVFIDFQRISGDHTSSYYIKNQIKNILTPANIYWELRKSYVQLLDGTDTNTDNNNNNNTNDIHIDNIDNNNN
jgi:NAD+--asparagine ADP-ribosyltransferase